MTTPTRIRLIEERKQRMWSQQELADRLGTTQNTVSRWELGRTTPNLYFAKRICEIFGKTPQDLGFLGKPASEAALPHSIPLLDPSPTDQYLHVSYNNAPKSWG